MKRTLYTAEHEPFRDLVKQFLEREVVPYYDEWERNHGVDRELYRKAGKSGLLGFAAPESLGGAGVDDFRYNALIIEEACKAHVLNAIQGMVLHTDVFIPYLLEYGTPEQLERWMPGLCSGDLVGAMAMTEPGMGSDLSSIKTTAVREGDTYRINGAKQFISNSSYCDLVIVICKTDDSPKSHNNLSMILVEATDKGFSRGKMINKIGQHSADTGGLFFDDVVVPATNLLGPLHGAFRCLVTRLTQERLTIAMTAVPHARVAFDDTLEYIKDRHAFGQPIGSFQNSRFQMATMWTELEMAQNFVDQQVLAYSRGELSAEDAAAAKWYASELNKRVLDNCLQLHGGYGYTEEYSIARAWRDGRVMSIYGGTTEILKDTIGKRVLGL